MPMNDATVEWIDGNFGSKVTMKYPCIILKEPDAKGHIISIAVAGKGQHQDAGAKVIHLAPHTSSTIVSKSISKEGGRTSYRGLLSIGKQAVQSKSTRVIVMPCYLMKNRVLIRIQLLKSIKN